MTELTVKEAAKALQVTERAVQIAAQKNRLTSRYVKGIGRGGRQLRISLESLPAEAQARYRGESTPHVDIMQHTSKQREEANAKAWAVEQYHQSKLSPDEFVAWFNNNNPPEDAITKSKLFRWQSKYRDSDVTNLIDRRGGHNRGTDTIPADAWNMFYRSAKSSCAMILPKRNILIFRLFQHLREKSKKFLNMQFCITEKGKRRSMMHCRTWNAASWILPRMIYGSRTII